MAAWLQRQVAGRRACGAAAGGGQQAVGRCGRHTVSNSWTMGRCFSGWPPRPSPGCWKNFSLYFVFLSVTALAMDDPTFDPLPHILPLKALVPIRDDSPDPSGAFCTVDPNRPKALLVKALEAKRFDPSGMNRCPLEKRSPLTAQRPPNAAQRLWLGFKVVFAQTT
jgi:hypothetical protein